MVEKQVRPDEGHGDVEYVPLLDVECSMQFMMEKGVTTATFIDAGDNRSFDDLAATVRARIHSMCAASPWIAARLVRDKRRHRNVLMRFNREPEPSDIDAIFKISDDPGLAALSEDDELRTTLTTVASSSAVVISGSKLVGRDARVCRFTLVRSSKSVGSQVRVLLVMSLSHAVADGFTYYQVFSQLAADRELGPLVPARKEADAALCRAGAGRAEYDWQFRPSLLVNILGSAMRGVKVDVFAHVIDPEKVAAAKTAELGHADPGRHVSFVSTNDLITAAYGRATRSRILLMAINWRGRLGTLNAQDAGNYESAVLFDPESYERASRIRASLQESPVVRTSDRPLPGCCEAMRCRFSMLTSWIFPHFSGELALTPDSKVLLHLPVYQPSEALFNVGIVFRPRKDAAALLCFASGGVTIDKLKEAGAPLGGPVL